MDAELEARVILDAVVDAQHNAAQDVRAGHDAPGEDWEAVRGAWETEALAKGIPRDQWDEAFALWETVWRDEYARAREERE